MGTAQLRRLKKQRQKERHKEVPTINNERGQEREEEHSLSGSEVEDFVLAPIFDGSELLEQFSNVISRFTPAAPTPEDGREEGGNSEDETQSDADRLGGLSDNEKTEEAVGLSKKELKRLNQIKLAELKQFAQNPEIVEWEDVTAREPKLLVQLKSSRHSVPVPRHWCQKRKYLSGKRGFVKPPFELPAFIKDTGVLEIREAIRAEDATKRIKVKAREKMHPKMGRMSVDYEKLYDAFFKYQTKPPLTMHGDLYFEGKEFEMKKQRKPGIFSEELRIALGMSSHLMPPPWLLAMQKYGPPPSYPHMRIQGVNAPIPDGAQWGYHPGGWGKPPNDALLRDGHSSLNSENPNQLMLLNPIERNLWGELEPSDEEESFEYESSAAAPGETVNLDEEQIESFVAASRSSTGTFNGLTGPTPAIEDLENKQVINPNPVSRSTKHK